MIIYYLIILLFDYYTFFLFYFREYGFSILPFFYFRKIIVYKIIITKKDNVGDKIMNSTILKCRNCGSILAIPTKDLCKIGKCTICESNKLEDFDVETSNKKCKMNALN